MEIKTKFNLGEIAYFFVDNKIEESLVKEINVSVEEEQVSLYSTQKRTRISYILEKGKNEHQKTRYYERELYKSRKEIAEAVLESTI